MLDQKIDNLLNLAMEATPQERAKSENLNVGYDSTVKLWDVIVKYSGPESDLGGDGIQAVPLLGGYAVVTLPETEIDAYSDRQQVEFIEKPKRLYFETLQAKEASCILPVQAGANGLTGEGILVGVVDSGVDYFHPDFRNEDGSSRILRLWDQSLDGKPPRGYVTGTEYTKEEIDKALALGETEGRRLVPSRDSSGHGTAVLGIAAGNGRASGGVNRGVAYKSDLLVVKMGNARENSFPRTTELMEGIDYLIRQTVKMRRPIAINISFGNNYGSHQGDSLLETYLSNAANVGRSVICVGSGNNGNDRIHTAGQLRQGQTETVEMSIGTYETTLNLQLWKAYADEIEISIETPSGERLPTLSEKIGTQRYRAGETDLLIYYGKPGPFQVTQEIYFDFIPVETYLTSGIWKIHLHGRRIREGNYNLWLPGGNVLNPVTGFYRPIAAETLTIPSTAAKVITVGAYDSRLNAYADFSGRGGSNLSFPKPDLVAPGVNITAPTPGGAYTSVTGTSFSTPFVTGSAALLMEWGIIQRNDPFLWGEKVKAYLRRGAQPLPGFNEYPNEAVGWGEDVIIRLH
jgi:minor extracellular serine protease Vpr